MNGAAQAAVHEGHAHLDSDVSVGIGLYSASEAQTRFREILGMQIMKSSSNDALVIHAFDMPAAAFVVRLVGGKMASTGPSRRALINSRRHISEESDDPYTSVILVITCMTLPSML